MMDEKNLVGETTFNCPDCGKEIETTYGSWHHCDLTCSCGNRFTCHLMKYLGLRYDKVIDHGKEETNG